ncbi:MAG: hypothetical protein GY863_20020 [bacterium]|nr:hypothetical protein [bacterium]
MLDRQLDINPEYYEYVNENFIPISLNSTYLEGKRLFSFYNVESIPTVLLIRHDGAEYERFERYTSPGKFLKKIKTAFDKIKNVKKGHIRR